MLRKEEKTPPADAQSGEESSDDQASDCSSMPDLVDLPESDDEEWTYKPVADKNDTPPLIRTAEGPSSMQRASARMLFAASERMLLAPTPRTTPCLAEKRKTLYGPAVDVLRERHAFHLPKATKPRTLCERFAAIDSAFVRANKLRRPEPSYTVTRLDISLAWAREMYGRTRTKAKL